MNLKDDGVPAVARTANGDGLMATFNLVVFWTVLEKSMSNRNSYSKIIFYISVSVSATLQEP